MNESRENMEVLSMCSVKVSIQKEPSEFHNSKVECVLVLEFGFAAVTLSAQLTWLPKCSLLF